MSDAIKNIFNSSIQFNQYLFGALLDIPLKNKEKITLDSKLISYVAQESGLPSVGALLIEEYIISGIEDDGPNTSKRTFREDNRENVSWIKLAELYKELEEWDTVRAIFLEKMDCKESLQKAITYESKSLYKLAAERYKELIDIDESQNRRDFYYDSYFKCFAHLGEWDKVPTAIAAVVDNKNAWKGLWEDEWYKQKLLPWYITSQVKNQLFTEESSQEFLDDINSALMDSKNSEYINQHFSEELCMLWMCEKDVQTANQYLRTSVKNFLEEWQSLNPIFQSQRFQKLLKLQNVIEISDFLEISTNLTDDIDLTVNRLNKRWLTSIKAPSSSIVLTETILLYRKQFIKILTDKLLSLSGEDTTQSVRELKKSKILMDIDLINKAADLGNFYMTKKHLKPYSNKDNPKLDLAKGTVFALKAKMATTDIPYQVNNYLEALKVYEKAWTSSKTELIVLASSSKFFDVVGDLSQILSNHNKTFSEYRQKLSNVLKKPVNILSDIEKYGLDILKASAEKCTVENMECDLNNDEEIAEKYKQLSKVYIKLAHFVKDKNDEDLRGDFILFVLRAMRMNSSEARQLFPCILMENDLGTKYKDIFTREVEKIPTWMFLGWIPQLLVNVDSSKVFAICDVIQRIAETYPQAIMYPYRLSKDNYNFDNNEVAAKAKLLINRLDNLLLKDEKINQFLKALSYVSVPANVLRYYVGKISNSSDSNITKKYLQSVQEEVFDQSRGSDNVNNMQGNMYKTIEKFKREFAKMLGLTPAKLKELCQNLYNVQLNNMLKKIKPSTLLKDYCPWLANFSANKMNMELEIPGQYDGQKLPLPQHHVKISGFYPEVKIMESIRKPIKITMVGFNTKEYPFLIKFGEDIRQDQRIEQLFCLMNNILKHDATCANNGLDILTYQVIPLTSSLGLIQWINDTEPLSDFIKKSFKDKKETDDFREEYHKFLKIGSNQNFVLAYAMAAEKIKKDKLIVNFKTLVKKIRWDILRESFWSLSVSTENYIALRNNFIKSYAVICVAHWILGIGDRHLSNSLICLRNGKVLGIDFGHAFGTGTQIQGVPELVPFRLTPHIVSLMEPLRERGSFRENMIQCIKCFRDNNASLLATMNVFIQEPSIDWLEHAAKSDDKRNDNWYPLVKIEQARRKLKGASSADIMEEELKANTKLGNYKNVYVKLVRGEENENLRTKFACREDLSVEDQVDCLLDHATDYNLLGRMWNGWYPWV